MIKQKIWTDDINSRSQQYQFFDENGSLDIQHAEVGYDVALIKGGNDFLFQVNLRSIEIVEGENDPTYLHLPDFDIETIVGEAYLRGDIVKNTFSVVSLEVDMSNKQIQIIISN